MSNMNFALKRGFLTSEFWITLITIAGGLIPYFTQSGNPVLIGVGTALGLVYKLGRFNIKKKDMNAAKRTGLWTSEFVIVAVFLLSGIAHELLNESSNHVLIGIGGVFATIYEFQRQKLKSLFLQENKTPFELEEDELGPVVYEEKQIAPFYDRLKKSLDNHQNEAVQAKPVKMHEELDLADFLDPEDI